MFEFPFKFSKKKINDDKKFDFEYATSKNLDYKSIRL